MSFDSQGLYPGRGITSGTETQLSSLLILQSSLLHADSKSLPGDTKQYWSNPSLPVPSLMLTDLRLISTCSKPPFQAAQVRKLSILYLWFKGRTLVFRTTDKELSSLISNHYWLGFYIWIQEVNEGIAESPWIHEIICKILCVCLFPRQKVHSELFFRLSKKTMIQTRG